MLKTMLGFAFAFALTSWSSPGFAKETPLVVATLPFDDAREQRAVFLLLSEHLSKALGRSVEFRASERYEQTIQQLASGEADVAFLGAVAYVKARRKGHVRAILRTIRHRSAHYYGIIVVSRDSQIGSVRELRNKKVAFVDPSSTGGYLFPRLLLKSAGLDPDEDIQTIWAGGHHRVVEMVAAGKVDAGACFEGAQTALVDPESVKAIARTEPVPGDPVVVRPGLGSELVNELRSALIELSTVPEAKPFFTFSEIDGFVPAVDSDYDRVAELLRRQK